MATLNVFANEINSLANRISQNIPRMVTDVAMSVVEFVADATPVDTGQASGNWKTQIGSPSSAWDAGPSSAQNSIDAARAALAGLREGQVVHITNNVPYIVELNQGSSRQAPVGFVESAIVIAIGLIGRYDITTR